MRNSLITKRKIFKLKKTTLSVKRKIKCSTLLVSSHRQSINFCPHETTHLPIKNFCGEKATKRKVKRKHPIAIHLAEEAPAARFQLASTTQQAHRSAGRILKPRITGKKIVSTISAMKHLN